MPGGYSKGDTRPPMRFILLILGLDVLGIGLAIPVMPTLIATIWPSSTEHVSLALGVALTLYSAMQFLCAPLLGALSDCHGRRPILLLALAGIGPERAAVEQRGSQTRGQGRVAWRTGSAAASIPRPHAGCAGFASGYRACDRPGQLPATGNDAFL